MVKAARFIALLAALTCGGESAGPAGTLSLTAIAPADGATDIETGVAVQATFSEPADPATVTPASFTLKVGGTALPAAVSYDAATHTARLVGPLLPNTLYQAEVTTGVTDTAGRPLVRGRQWTFATRAWQAVTLDQAGLVGQGTSLARDASGRLHLAYWSHTGWDLKYATCAANCAVLGSWQFVAVDTAGDVGTFQSLALDGSDRVHVTYYDFTNLDLRYATCAANCADMANWQTVSVDTTGDVGANTSLFVQGSGRLHVTYHDLTNGVLKYASCGGSCTNAANWQTVPVDQPAIGFTESSLAGDGTGRLHVAYHDVSNDDLKYATCASGCTVPGNWTTVAVDQAGIVGYSPSLAVEGGGRVHVTTTYYSPGYADADIRYASCASGCTAPSAWQSVTIGTLSLSEESSFLVVDAVGRLHLGYNERSGEDLRYATCATACTTAANWRSAAVDQAGRVGANISFVVDPAGRVHMSYYDYDNADLKFIE